MRDVVLADTGPLYAIADPSDALHERSLADQSRLQAEGLKTAISYSTLQEAHNLVLRKLGRSKAHSFLRELLATSLFTVPTAEDYNKAARRVLRYPDQDISLADALCAEVGEKLDAPIWTFDHHFDVMGVSVWR